MSIDGHDAISVIFFARVCLCAFTVHPHRTRMGISSIICFCCCSIVNVNTIIDWFP